MRDLRIGAALAVTFASLLAASIAFAQQPAAQPPSQNPAQVGEDPPAVSGQTEHLIKQADNLVSAKESPINDKSWWLDRGTALSDEQKQKIHQIIVSRSDIRVPASPDLHAEASAVLPTWVVLSELPDELTAEIPYIRNFKVVLTGSKVLLIDPTGRAVATVIDESSTNEIKK
jgi:hypothetical protein